MPSAQVVRRLMERLPIRTPNLRLVPLKFNAAQERLWTLIEPDLDANRPIRVIILKPRRTGMSTFCEALLTALCVLGEYYQCMVIAHEAAATRRIWEMSERFITGSPLKAIGKSKGSVISFGTSKLELATAGSPNAARGTDLTACHLSEVSAWKQPEAMLATLQCLPRTYGQFSLALIETTARGMTGDGALFYDEWQRAEAGESGFTPFFFGWPDFPDYTDPPYDLPLDDLDSDEEALLMDRRLTWGQLRWRRRILITDCNNDPELFAQEYPATASEAFIMSGLPFFRRSELLWLEQHIHPGKLGRLEEVGARIRFVPDQGGWLRVWQRPEPGHEYVVGADSSMGMENFGTALSHSRSAGCILDMASQEQVAEYDQQAAPHVFARHLALIGRWYNEALLAPEVQSSGGGGGREIIVYLRDKYSYPNIHVWRHADRIRREQGTLYGWETNARTRPRMIARLREVMSERSSILHSRTLVTQLRNFGENESGRLEALAGHDDLLFAYGIALMSRSENYVALMLGQTQEPGYGPETFQRLGLSHWQEAQEMFAKHQELVESDAARARGEWDAW